MTAILQVTDLRKSYAGVHALDGVSLAVEAGSITGLIGPNGSGKSTAIDCISGFQKLDSGKVVLAGNDITGQLAHHIARAGLMRTFQTVRIYERLCLRDNLAIAAQQFDPATWVDEFLRTRRYRQAVDKAEGRARELVELIGLKRYWEIETGILSYGQKKLVARDRGGVGRAQPRRRDLPDRRAQCRVHHQPLPSRDRARPGQEVGRRHGQGDPHRCARARSLSRHDAGDGRGRDAGRGMNPALELVSVTAGYGDVPIVRDFSARLQAGTITTLIGGNGAGKSTLLRAIYGTNRLFSGQIVFKGETIERLPPWERLKRGVGFVPQGRCNFPAMSVAENLKMGCYTLPKAVHDSAIDRVTGSFPMLRQKWRTDAGNLSGGEQQILEMAMVLLVEPALLLLDEPSLGLSPKMQGDVFTTVQRIAGSGVTVLVVEQNVRGALLISDRALVMEQGRLFMEGPAEEVRTDPRIKQAYLGGNIHQTAA
jgi:ABC-type branched-subunit amino acid transport system ATPase component